MHLVGVVLQIEKLNVIVLENFLQRLRCVESGRRVVARELVAAIEDNGENAMSSFGWVTGGWGDAKRERT